MMEAPKEENMKSIRKKAGLVIFSVLAVSSLTLWFLAVVDHARALMGTDSWQFLIM